MKIRRKTLLGIIEKVAAALVLLDAVLYFAVVRPLVNSVRQERAGFAAARQSLRADQARLKSLQRDQSLLPVTEEALQGFLKQRVPPRRRAYSRAASTVRGLTQQCGVQLSGIGYRLYPAKKEPLDRLRIVVEVEGTFPSLLKFTHAMETTQDLLLVRGFAIQPSEAGTLSLRLAADLYVTP